MAGDWKVLPHGPLLQLADNLWVVEGDLPRGRVGRRMAVFRLADGRLVVHSPIALELKAMEELDRLGPVDFIVVPNGLHRIDAPRYHGRYPMAEVLCPPGARKRVARAVTVAGGPERLPADPGLRWELLDGCGEREAAFIVTEPDGATDLVVTDAIFNLPARPAGLDGLVVRMLGSAGGPKVTWLARRLLVRDPGAMAAHLRRLSELPALRRVIMAHGRIIEEGAPGILRSVADRLSPAPEAG